MRVVCTRVVIWVALSEKGHHAYFVAKVEMRKAAYLEKSGVPG